MARRGENIHKRKDGRWEGRYIKARTLEGKIQWGYIYGAAYAEVKQVLIRKKAEAGFYNLKRTDLTFEALAEVWLHSLRNSSDFIINMYRCFTVRSLISVPMPNALVVNKNPSLASFNNITKTPFLSRKPAKGRVLNSLSCCRTNHSMFVSAKPILVVIQHGTSSTFERRTVISSSQRST